MDVCAMGTRLLHVQTRCLLIGSAKYKSRSYNRCLSPGVIWPGHKPALVTLPLSIANFCSLPLLFGQALGKLQGKMVTHSEEVGWWRTLMVECVTLFLTIWCIWDCRLTKLLESIMHIK